MSDDAQGPREPADPADTAPADRPAEVDLPEVDPRRRRRLLVLLAVVCVLAYVADQATKWIALQQLADGRVVPVVDGGGVHRYTVLAKAHLADCGNSVPTTYVADATDVYNEGALIFPCVQVQEGYREREDVVRMARVRIRVPDHLLRYRVEKGSVTVDGVSLTVVEPLDDGFTVAIIPHTASVTTLGSRVPGDRVNIEVDVVAKYVERLAEPHLVARGGAS